MRQSVQLLHHARGQEIRGAVGERIPAQHEGGGVDFGQGGTGATGEEGGSVGEERFEVFGDGGDPGVDLGGFGFRGGGDEGGEPVGGDFGVPGVDEEVDAGLGEGGGGRLFSLREMGMDKKGGK